MNPLIKIITDETGTVLVLSCVYKCIESFEGWRKPSNWNEVDDVMEEVMDRILIEVDNRCTAILYMFACNITTLPMKRPAIFSNLIDIEHLDRVIATCEKSVDEKHEIFKQLREIFSAHHNQLVARWTKRLFKTFEDRDIIGKAEEIRYILFVRKYSICIDLFNQIISFKIFLQIMHVVYLCAFYGSPWFMGMKWEEFLHELVSNFMKLVANNFNREIFIDVSFVF